MKKNYSRDSFKFGSYMLFKHSYNSTVLKPSIGFYSYTHH